MSDKQYHGLRCCVPFCDERVRFRDWSWTRYVCETHREVVKDAEPIAKESER